MSNAKNVAGAGAGSMLAAAFVLGWIFLCPFIVLFRRLKTGQWTKPPENGNGWVTIISMLEVFFAGIVMLSYILYICIVLLGVSLSMWAFSAM